MTESREVIVYFGKEHKVKVETENPGEIMDLIVSEPSGWFRYGDLVIRRDEIKCALIVQPKIPIKAVRKKKNNEKIV